MRSWVGRILPDHLTKVPLPVIRPVNPHPHTGKNDGRGWDQGSCVKGVPKGLLCGEVGKTGCGRLTAPADSISWVSWHHTI